MSEVKRYETDISNIWIADKGWMVEYSDYAALAKRVDELEFERDYYYAAADNRHVKKIQEQDADITRLRVAAATSIRKCEQYWNEHNIPDEEVHAALELIHNKLCKALGVS